MILLASSYSFAQNASIEVTETTESIDYRASSPVAFLKEIAKAQESLMEKWGELKWQVTTRAGYDVSASGCGLKNVQVSLDITFRFPNWASSLKNRGTNRKWWQRFKSFTLKHEQDHKQIVISTLEEMQQAMENLEPRSSCSAMRKVFEQTRDQYLTEIDKKNQVYDREFVEDPRFNDIYRTARLRNFYSQ